MDRNVPVQALIGFVIGALMGAVISLGGEWLGNWLMVWRGLAPRMIHWWDALLLAIILGLAMAINMTRPPFGD